MNKKFSFKNLLILSLICISIIIIPIILFLINFREQSISKDITDWASFGGYISGVINTFVAIISLIVLSYLTYFVSRQSSSENKNVNLLIRRLDAYESLISHLPKLQSSIDDMTWNVQGALKHIDIPSDEKDFEKYLDKIFEAVRNFKELHFFLTSFSDRYEHLFNYDFDSTEFSELMDASDDNAEFYDTMLQNLYKRKVEIPSGGEEKIENYIRSLTTFAASLKKELDAKS